MSSGIMSQTSGCIRKSGLPDLLQWAVISREYEDEIYLAPFTPGRRVEVAASATAATATGRL